MQSSNNNFSLTNTQILTTLIHRVGITASPKQLQHNDNLNEALKHLIPAGRLIPAAIFFLATVLSAWAEKRVAELGVEPLTPDSLMIEHLKSIEAGREVHQVNITVKNDVVLLAGEEKADFLQAMEAWMQKVLMLGAACVGSMILDPLPGTIGDVVSM